MQQVIAIMHSIHTTLDPLPVSDLTSLSLPFEPHDRMSSVLFIHQQPISYFSFSPRADLVLRYLASQLSLTSFFPVKSPKEQQLYMPLSEPFHRLISDLLRCGLYDNFLSFVAWQNYQPVRVRRSPAGVCHCWRQE
jgi:hypothetical protein